MANETEPPRKFYRFKATEFKRVNKPAGTTPTPTASDPSVAPLGETPIDVKALVREGAKGMPLLSGNAPSNRENDVHRILRKNHLHAEAAGLNAVVPRRKRPSRRKRDYWLLFTLGNGGFAFWAFGPFANTVTFMYGIGGMAFYTAALTWVMWMVMDDY